MEYRLLLILALLTALALVGCSAAPTSTGSDVVATSVTNAPALAPALQLAVGALQLERTPHAVDASQAAELAFLWQAYGALDAQDATAPAELEALRAQIQATMTAEQLEAIAAMQLDTATIPALAAERGLETSGVTAKTANASAQSDGPVMGPGGDGPPPTDGAMPAMDGATGGSATNAASLGRGQDMILASVVQELVTVLRAKI